MLDEKEVLLQAEREQRNQDMLLMRKLDRKLGIERHEVTDVLLECNQRIIEYVFQFKAFSLDFLTLQTIQDFKNHLIVMQNKKLDKSKPVFLLRDGNNTKIFVSNSITKQMFYDDSNNGIIYFLREEFVSK